ncbi:uncharacterized protein LOC115033706 [Acyrthosiphon pisum]|uniref:Uncharacterized protein n=1 Tax=Acyrthosiphon pisum TaxID=7029 RepID=A0A8R2JN80_ACYPI|nr:uncharacterized protein LOC115033706 [Acyrthosiphon pisum]
MHLDLLDHFQFMKYQFLLLNRFQIHIPVGIFGVFIDLSICLPWNFGKVQSIKKETYNQNQKQCSININDDICSLSYSNNNVRHKRGPGNRNEHQLNEAQVFILFMGFVIEHVVRRFLSPAYQDYTITILNQEKTLQDVLQVSNGVCEHPHKQSSRVIDFSFMYDSNTGRVLDQPMANFLNLTPTEQYISLLQHMINVFQKNPPTTDLNNIREFQRKVKAVVTNRQSDLFHYKGKLDVVIQEQSSICIELINNMIQSQINHDRILRLWMELNRLLENYIAVHTDWSHDELKK